MTKTITVAGQTFNEYTADVNGVKAKFCALMDRTPLRRNAHLFLTQARYDRIAADLRKLSRTDRQVLLDIEQIAQTPSQKRAGMVSPLETMTDRQREAFDTRLRDADLSVCGNVLAVNYDDMKGLGAMRRQTIYSVGGRPVPAVNMTPEMVAAVHVSKQRLINERANGIGTFSPVK